MKKPFTLLLLFITCSIFASNNFTVLAVAGEVLKTTKNSTYQLKIGDDLIISDQISLGENSYLGLINETGQMVELKQVGKYSVSTLLENTPINEELAKYAQKIEEGWFALNKEEAKKSYRKTGSVSCPHNRGLIVYGEYRISVIEEIPLKLHWNYESKTDSFKVRLNNLFNENLINIITDNSILIDAKDFDLNDQFQQNLLLIITSINNPGFNNGSNTDNMNHQVTFKKDEEIVTLMNTFKNKTALDYLLMAMIYEQNNYTNYVIDCYYQAMVLEPEVDAYRVQFEEYFKTKFNRKYVKNYR